MNRMIGSLTVLTVVLTQGGRGVLTQQPTPGQPAELIAQNIPSPASMCYDAGDNQLVIPMNANNAPAFIPLG